MSEFTVTIAGHGFVVSHTLPATELSALIQYVVSRAIRPEVSEKTVAAMRQKQLGELK